MSARDAARSRDSVAPGNGNRTSRRGLCPTPGKMSFSTRSEAAAMNKRAVAAGGNSLRAYLCTCGRWHLTRKTKRQAKLEGLWAA